MPRYNVENNGKWACFSSIVDDFVTEFMDKERYEEWRKAEYGLLNYKPAEKCNIMTFFDAVHSIRFNQSKEDTTKSLLKSGLLEEEFISILENVEYKHFRPELGEEGVYKCPICEEVVEKNQKICGGCKRELVWGKE